MKKIPVWLVALALGVGSGFGDDWPRFRGVSFDGVSREKDWLGTWEGGAPKTLWKASVGTGYSSVTVANGRVYTMGHSGKNETLYCFDASKGDVVWKYTYDQELGPKYYEGGPSSTPTISDGKVYVLTRFGDVFCLEETTGSVIWKKNIHKELGCEVPEWGFAGSPHLEGGLLILNAGSHGVALKASNGEKVWSSGKDPSGYSTPVPFLNEGKRALAIMTQKHVVAVEPTTGRELWRHPWKTQYDVNAADPVVDGDMMFLTSGYGTGGAVIRFGGNKTEQIWFNKEVRGHMSSPVVIGGTLFGVDGNGDDKQSRLKALDLKTGKVLWTSPGSNTGSLAAADGKLIWLTGTGEVVVVEARPGAYKELARAQVGGGKFWTAPVLANGRLYVRNSKGEITCADVKGSVR